MRELVFLVCAAALGLSGCASTFEQTSWQMVTNRNGVVAFGTFNDAGVLNVEMVTGGLNQGRWNEALNGELSLEIEGAEFSCAPIDPVAGVRRIWCVTSKFGRDNIMLIERGVEPIPPGALSD